MKLLNTVGNYNNFLNALRIIFATLMADAPVPPNFMVLNVYSLEGLGVDFKNLKDKWIKTTPYSYITVNQFPVQAEDQNVLYKSLRPPALFIRNNDLKGTFMPKLYEDKNTFLVPLWQRLQSTFTYTIVAPSMALAYEYSRFLSSIFHVNKYFSFRDIPFNHYISTSVSTKIPPDVYSELKRNAIVLNDTISNRDLLTFFGTNWYMLKMDSIEVTPEGVPYEGEEIRWKVEASFSMMFNDVFGYHLYLKSGAAFSLPKVSRTLEDSFRIGNKDLTALGHLIYESSGEYLTTVLTENNQLIRVNTPILIDTTSIGDTGINYPREILVEIKRDLARIFKVLPYRRINSAKIEELFYNALQYLATGDLAFKRAYKEFTSLVGEPVFFAFTREGQQFKECSADCFSITEVSRDDENIKFKAQVEAPGILFFGKRVDTT